MSPLRSPFSLLFLLVSLIDLEVAHSSTRAAQMKTKLALPKRRKVDASPSLNVVSTNNVTENTELPPVDSWPHRPLFLQGDKETILPGLKSPNHPCPVGVPFEFETELFKGRALIRFRDLETSNNPTHDKAYFQGRKRQSQFIIQGQFKQPIKVSDVVTGREFEKPLKVAPPPFVSRIIRKVLGRVAPSVELDLSSETPKVTANFAGSVQALRADVPGTEPDITSVDDIQEDTSMFHDAEYKDGMSVQKRKRLFSDPHKASRHSFDTETVYTFNNYDDSFNYVNYSIDLKIFRFDMTSTLDGQPFQVMAKNKATGKHLWSFHIWNEHLLVQ